jgi:hypothetical protein
VKLPSPCPSLCGIAKGNDLIYVVTAEGYFYQYKVLPDTDTAPLHQ